MLGLIVFGLIFALVIAGMIGGAVQIAHGKYNRPGQRRK